MDGLVEDCSNSIANALELLQPYIYMLLYGAYLMHFDPMIYLWNTVSVNLDLSYAHV